MHLLVISGFFMVGMSNISPLYRIPLIGLTTQAVPAPNISSSYNNKQGEQVRSQIFNLLAKTNSSLSFKYYMY